jgi:hypothetical protein
MEDALYFGGEGTVYLADSGLSDDGEAITGDVKPAFSAFGAVARQKRFAMVRPHLVVDGAVSATMDAKIDFEEGIPSSVPTFSPASGAEWDEGDWDTADWGDAAAINKNWSTVAGVGRVATFRLRTSSSNGTLRMHGADWLYEPAIGFV